MAHPHSGHLWNAAILAAAVTLALAADRLSASAQPAASTPRASGALGDLAQFAAALGADSATPRFVAGLRHDPFAAGSEGSDEAFSEGVSVASGGGRPTVTPKPAPTRTLTAILIANDRPVAVINDRVVEVGDDLEDGARVSAIQADVVWVVEKNGKWRKLTLTPGRP